MAHPHSPLLSPALVVRSRRPLSLPQFVLVAHTMPLATIPVPFFYEPPSPPIPLPLLTAEMDLPELRVGVEHIIHQEVDVSKPARRNISFATASARTRRERSASLVLSRSATPEARQPIPNAARREGSTSTSGEESPNDDSASDGSDSEDSVVESSDDGEIKIAKPPGEVGCPGRGGYSLEQVLDWPPKRMKAFKVYRIC